MKRYLFFLRHYNDIDNIAPAIYFFLEAQAHHRADVILYDDSYDFRNNLNLRLLKDTFPTRFSYTWLGEYFGLDIEAELSETNTSEDNISEAILSSPPLSIWERTQASIQKVDRFSQRLLFISPLGPVRWARHWWRRFQRWWHWLSETLVPTPPPPPPPPLEPPLAIKDICYGWINNNLIFSGIEAILQENKFPSLVIFDINRSVPIAGLLSALRRGGVPEIIALPVSPLINYNILREEKFINIYSQHFRDQHDYSGIDKLAYVDEHFVNAFNHFFQILGLPSTLAGKTVALGSLRYSPQWLRVREKLVPQYKHPSGKIQTNKTKVVFFPSHAKSNVNWAEFQRSLDLISLFPEYEVVVKYHTRHNITSDDDSYQNIHYEPNVDSSALINWGDIVMFWSSSIAIEGYIKGKTMVCLSYIVGNRNLYVDYDAGYVAKCRDDFLFFLLSFHRHSKSQIPGYNQSGINKLIEHMIAPGGKNTVDNYLEFMSSSEF